ncbi:hypothetical protein BH23GEM9_BH23GEM9_16770 [soil metagenome]
MMGVRRITRVSRRALVPLAGIIVAGVSYAAITARFVSHTAAASFTSGSGIPGSVEAPVFEVDPLWPQPLPSHWLFGSVVGVAVDEDDRVYVLNRPNSFNARTEIGAASDPPTGDCCLPAPAILVFDNAGALVAHWGGPARGYEWPTSSHRLSIDPGGTIWIGGTGERDAHLLRFSRDGSFIGQFGAPVPEAAAAPAAAAPAGPFQRVAKVSFDAVRNVAYIADGSRRVLAADPATGAVRSAWGAYGESTPADAEAPSAYDPAAPAARQFRNVHCAEPANDGLVYVCDRESNRIQVFRHDGSFVNETVIAPATLAGGSVWDVAFSRDPQQRFMYVADGTNMRIHVLDRASLEHLTSFGAGGRQPGQFSVVHSIATDSHGNLYTGETLEGKRVQKFVFRGIGQVAREQGVLWPVARSRR